MKVGTLTDSLDRDLVEIRSAEVCNNCVQPIMNVLVVWGLKGLILEGL